MALPLSNPTTGSWSLVSRPTATGARDTLPGTRPTGDAAGAAASARGPRHGRVGQHLGIAVGLGHSPLVNRTRPWTGTVTRLDAESSMVAYQVRLDRSAEFPHVAAAPGPVTLGEGETSCCHSHEAFQVQVPRIRPVHAPWHRRSDVISRPRRLWRSNKATAVSPAPGSHVLATPLQRCCRNGRTSASHRRRWAR